MINYIISLTLLIAAIVLIRTVFRKKIAPRMMYALWLVVLVRMLLPFPLFQVTLPEIAKPTPIEPTEPVEPIIEDTTPVYNDYSSDFVVQEQPETIQNIGYSDTFVPHESVTEPTDTIPSEIIAEPETEASDELIIGTTDTIPKVTEPASPLSVNDVLNIVWAVGAAVILLWFTVSGAVFSHGLKKDRQLHSVVGKTKIYLSSGVGSPCVSGLIPVIYINPEAAENSDVDYIVKHEMTHIFHGDNIWAIFRILALTAFWYNPFVWLAAFLSKRDAELAVDDSIAARLDESERIDYARAILAAVPVKRGFVSGFGSAPLKERLLTLTKKRKTSVIALILAVTLTLSAVGCAFIGTKEKAPDEDIADDLEAEPAKKESDYAAAVALYKSGNYKEARAAFYRLGDYRNSVKYYLSIEARPCKTVYKGQYFDLVSTVGYDEYGNILYRASDDVVEYKRDYTYDENDRILTSYIEDHDDSMTETYTYTDSGYSMIRDTVSGGNTERYEQIFNDKDQCVKEIYRREDGSGFFIEYEFDGDGNFLKSYSADLDGNFISLYVNEYDEHGNVISKINNYYGDVQTYLRTYDDHGNITSDKHTFSDGTEEISERRYRYDEYGNIIYEVIRGENGKTVTETTFEGIEPYGSGFCYGKKTVNSTYSSKDGSVLYSGKTVYDPSERLLYSFRDDGETQITEEYTYDVFGNHLETVTEEKNLKNSKTERSSVTYTYDEDGNLIKYESKKDNKKGSTEEYSDFVYFVKDPLELDEILTSEETKTVLLNTVTTKKTPSRSHKYVNEYDEYGRLIKSTAYTDGEEFSVTEYTYDEYGCQNSEKYVSDEMSYTYEWTNNTDGNRLKGTEKTKQKSELSSFESEYEYTYDEKGRAVSYDSTTVSKRAMIFGKTTTEQHRTYEYTDEYGSYIMKEWGDDIPETVYQFIFDENGNIDEEIVLTDGSETMRTKCDSHGYSLTVWRKTASGEEVTKFENSYENDLLTKMIKKGDDGKIISTTVNTYDGDGHILSSVTTGEDGTETSNTVYEYEEFEIKVSGVQKGTDTSTVKPVYDKIIDEKALPSRDVRSWNCTYKNYESLLYKINDKVKMYRPAAFTGDYYAYLQADGNSLRMNIADVSSDKTVGGFNCNSNYSDSDTVILGDKLYFAPSATGKNGDDVIALLEYDIKNDVLNTVEEFPHGNIKVDISALDDKIVVFAVNRKDGEKTVPTVYAYDTVKDKLTTVCSYPELSDENRVIGMDTYGGYIYVFCNSGENGNCIDKYSVDGKLCETASFEPLDLYTDQGYSVDKMYYYDSYVLFRMNSPKLFVLCEKTEDGYKRITLSESTITDIINPSLVNGRYLTLYSDSDSGALFAVDVISHSITKVQRKFTLGDINRAIAFFCSDNGKIIFDDEDAFNNEYQHTANNTLDRIVQSGLNSFPAFTLTDEVLSLAKYFREPVNGTDELLPHQNLYWYLTDTVYDLYKKNLFELENISEKEWMEEYLIPNEIMKKTASLLLGLDELPEKFYSDDFLYKKDKDAFLYTPTDRPMYGTELITDMRNDESNWSETVRITDVEGREINKFGYSFHLVVDDEWGYMFRLSAIYNVREDGNITPRNDVDRRSNIDVNIISGDTPLFVKSKRYFSVQKLQNAENSDAVQLATIYDNIAGTYLTDYVFVLGNYGIKGVSTKENGEAEYLYGKQIVNNGTDKSEKVCIYKTDPFEILYDGNGMEWPTFVYDGERIFFFDSFRGRAHDVVSSDGKQLHTDAAYNSLDLLPDGNLILCGENSFTVYDKDFKAVHESKKYDYVLYDAQANYLYVRVDGKMMLTDAYETYLKPYEDEQYVRDTSYPFLETNQFMDIFVRFFHDEYSKGEELKGNALYATALLCINAAQQEKPTFSIVENEKEHYVEIKKSDIDHIAGMILGSEIDLTKYHGTLGKKPEVSDPKFNYLIDEYFSGERVYHFIIGRDYWNDDPVGIDHDTVVIEENSSKLIYSARIDIYEEQFSGVVVESKYLTYTFDKVFDNELRYLRLVSIEDTASCEIVSERTSDFTDGMAAVECDVYPFPDDSTKSIGIMWLHKRVFVEAVATVRNTITGEVSDWYQISCTDKHGNAARFTGWVPASCVEKYDENASVPDNALYQIKPGAEYTIDGVTKTLDKDSMNVIMVLDRTEENGSMKFTAYGGSSVTVNSKDCVEEYDRFIPPAWANVP